MKASFSDLGFPPKVRHKCVKMENKLDISAAEELLKKIQKLEEGQTHLKEEISNLKSSGILRRKPLEGGGGVNLTETEYVNILQSMSQALHIFDHDGVIIYWNQMAQNLYGYTVTEAIGKTAPDIIIGPKYADLATHIIERAVNGESWSGEFPVRNKRWEKFTVITTVSPCCDENGTVVGVMCVSTDARPFREIRTQASVSAPWRISSSKFGLDPQQPLKTAIASKISNLASKVKSKINTHDNNHHSDNTPCEPTTDESSGLDPQQPLKTAIASKLSILASKVKSKINTYNNNHYSDNATCEPTTDESSCGNENKPGLHKVLSSKAEAWMGKKGISWPWKGKESEGDEFNWRPWSHNEQDQQESIKVENQPFETVSNNNTNEAPESWNSSCGASSSTSTNSSSVNKIDIDIDNLDVEISWDDLTIGEQIGQGSCGTVYHALWYGSDVAIKVFTKQEYPDDVILSFRKEVSLMKRLRHPNILLFMGAVTSPHNLCIVTEFLPRLVLLSLLSKP